MLVTSRKCVGYGGGKDRKLLVVGNCKWSEALWGDQKNEELDTD